MAENMPKGSTGSPTIAQTAAIIAQQKPRLGDAKSRSQIDAERTSEPLAGPRRQTK